jgi:hypothetical protein
VAPTTTRLVTTDTQNPLAERSKKQQVESLPIPLLVWEAWDSLLTVSRYIHLLSGLATVTHARHPLALE